MNCAALWNVAELVSLKECGMDWLASWDVTWTGWHYGRCHGVCSIVEFGMGWGAMCACYSLVRMVMLGREVIRM